MTSYSPRLRRASGRKLPSDGRRLYRGKMLEARRRHYLSHRARRFTVDRRGRIKDYQAGENDVDQEHCDNTENPKDESVPDGWDPDDYRTMLNAMKQRDRYLELAEKARKDMESHRAGYRGNRGRHFEGQDPGLSGWNPQWTREEFDIHHLEEAMRLSGILRQLEERLIVRMRLCAWVGAEPLASQANHFTHKDTGYAESLEQEMRDSAPREAIKTWKDGLGKAAKKSTEASEGRLNLYSPDHVVEYPDTIASKTGPDIDPGDSLNLQGRVMAPGQTDNLQVERPHYEPHKELAKAVRWQPTNDVRRRLNGRYPAKDDDPIEGEDPMEIEDPAEGEDPKVLRSHMY
ncbi:uncharacterized protein LTR77_007702 [Saxophila tyrrhenica]|uniref:Uncharacterized protein n=1 Tax=Saxophila tyrrhenica TaxID=1690608 RepID=A0AAV9P6S6_9PEZI|nr:hypothetical protein LTR77_007702 [Saxophila tyrrhenica]